MLSARGLFGSDPPGGPWSATGRVRALLTDRSEVGRGRRFAAFAFGARVTNAGLGFALQIFLARWMGERNYGIYASVWVWVLLLGGIASVGLPVAAMKFVPDYRERGDLAGLRGFIGASRTLGIAPSIGLGFLLLAACLVGQAASGPYGQAASVAAAIIPLYVLTDVQTGLARACDFQDLGLVADYLLRPLLLLVSVALLAAWGLDGSPRFVMTVTLAAVAATALTQGIPLHRRLAALAGAGPTRSDLRRWLATCWPLLGVTSFTLLIDAADILVLQIFASPEEVATYFAATKIVAIASFVSYGVANTSAHRFAAHVARGDRAGLAALAAQTLRWTFWPTLLIAVVLSLSSMPLLRLFGTSFVDGAPIVALLVVGILATAAVGPADRALAMADHGRVTAGIFAAAAFANLCLALALVPFLGLYGAALATVGASVLRSVLLVRTARRRLGLTMLVFAPRTAA